MFCPMCGSRLPNEAAFCPNCGTPVGEYRNHVRRSAPIPPNPAETRISPEVNPIPEGASSDTFVRRLKDDRSLIVHIILALLTCGIYTMIFFHQIAEDTNIACEGDGKDTPGLLKLILLTMITCGIYQFVWYYDLGNRLAENAPRYGLHFADNGSSVLLWLLLGSLLCGIGPFVALNIIFKNSNALFHAYNREHGLA